MRVCVGGEGHGCSLRSVSLAAVDLVSECMNVERPVRFGLGNVGSGVHVDL